MTEDEWRAQFRACWICGWRCGRWHKLGPAKIEKHHIDRRSQVANYQRCDVWENWFAACTHCHADDLAAMPHSRQLAYKWVFDPCGYKVLGWFLRRWLRVRDPGLKAPLRIEVAEVLSEITALGLVKQ